MKVRRANVHSAWEPVWIPAEKTPPRLFQYGQRRHYFKFVIICG